MGLVSIFPRPSRPPKAVGSVNFPSRNIIQEMRIAECFEEQIMIIRRLSFLVLVLITFVQSPVVLQAQSSCPPTAPDAEGPFYKPSVPLRDRTGSGLVISGKVLAADSCLPIPGSRVEWWQANPQGSYDDAHRGALITDSAGEYRLETDVPPPYYGRPPHVHFKIMAPGYSTLTTQIYPGKGEVKMTFDFVLMTVTGRR